MLQCYGCSHFLSGAMSFVFDKRAAISSIVPWFLLRVLSFALFFDHHREQPQVEELEEQLALAQAEVAAAPTKEKDLRALLDLLPGRIAAAQAEAETIRTSQ
jgi:hypothetical protein